MAVVGGADPRIEETALTLGASRARAAFTVLMELRRGILAAIVTGFGRLISELGVALMVGGNIQDSTRTMTTAIALESSKGDFAFGFALGVILLALALAVNVGVSVLTPGR
jgi:tungstate transport system permease protein